MINIATTKIWKINQRIDKVINYIANDVKTENKEFVTGINTILDNSVNDMNLSKMRFNKQNGILGYHCYQSFKGKEISDKKAHEIGIELANQLWGDRFQVIVATHTNTKNTHNHFFINSVSFVDGKRFYNNKENLAKLRETSDNICADYGLRVLKENSYYSSFSDSYNRKDKYVSIVRKDIDRAISVSKNYQYFLNNMKKVGYEIVGKNPYEKLVVRKDNYKRNIRVERNLGADYSIEMICSKIRNRENIIDILPVIRTKGKYSNHIGNVKNKKRVSGIKALYYHYCYLFKIFPMQKTKKLTKNQKLEVKKLNEFTREIRFLGKYKINNMDELEVFKESKIEELNILKDKREKLWKKFNKVDDTNKKDSICDEIQNITILIKACRNNINLSKKVENKQYEMINRIKEKYTDVEVRKVRNRER